MSNLYHLCMHFSPKRTFWKDIEPIAIILFSISVFLIENTDFVKDYLLYCV